MNRKTLRMNRFGECILSEIDLFNYSVEAIHQKYPNLPNNDSNVYQVNFNWTWNGFEGYGEIDFYKRSAKLCNKPGEDLSNMTVSSKSKRQQPNGRQNCALYNDDSLGQLFELMLSQINLSNAISYDEWMSGISK